MRNSAPTMTTRAERTDLMELGPPEVLPSGFVKYDAFVARAGCLTYLDPPRTEYRPHEENVKAVAAMEGVPVTLIHPTEGQVTVANSRGTISGTVLQPHMDGERIRVKLLVTDASAIQAIKTGATRQLSLGYSADVEQVPGVSPSGERYDCVQRNLVVNHVALVPEGRAGAGVALRADKRDVPVVKEQTMMIRIDGKDVEATDVVAGYVQGLVARTDKLEAELKALPERIRAEERVRSDAIAVATKVGSQTTGSLAEIQAAVATKVLGLELKADAAPEYVAGCYAAALKISERDSKPVQVHVDSSADPLEAARSKYLNSINGSK